MKKINSIGYGGKILGLAVTFAFFIPVSIKLVMMFYENTLLAIFAKISLGIGIIILVFFAILLTIEFHQDKKQDLYYSTQRNVKLKLGKAAYECQACGNRRVTSTDKNCSICGIFFKDMGEKNETHK